MSKPRIPDPHSTAALSISDGHQTAGFVIHHDGSWFAFDADAVLVGEFKTQREAIRAIPNKKERAR